MRVGLAIAVLAFAVAAHSQQPPKAPQINSQDHPKGALEAEKKSSGPETKGQQFSSPVPVIVTLAQNQQAAKQTNQSEQEGTEFWSILGLKLKITDTLLVIFTCLLFVATWRLWRSTDDLVEGAERTAERQLRAYVFPKLINSEYIVDNTGANRKHQVHIFPMWENTGSTPTRHMLTRSVYKIFDDGEMPDTFDFPEEREKAEIAVIGPRITIEGDKMVVDAAHFAHVIAKLAHMYVWGWADYNDVFEGTPRHRTEFCYKVEVIEKIDAPQRYFLTASFYRKHNGADDECYRQPQPFVRPS